MQSITPTALDQQPKVLEPWDTMERPITYNPNGIGSNPGWGFVGTLKNEQPRVQEPWANDQTSLRFRRPQETLGFRRTGFSKCFVLVLSIVLHVQIQILMATLAPSCSAQSPVPFNPPIMNQPGDNTPSQNQQEQPQGFLNWQLKTLGGSQFWSDVRYAGNWRIQQNSETHHHRLLNQNNVRMAWGNRLHCDQKLDQAIANGQTRICSGKVVIVLHGLIRTSGSMATMAKFLNDQEGYSTINFQYASTRRSVGDHATALRSVIDNLGPEVTEIYFVGHSLGNLVVRRYLGDTQNQGTGAQGDPRIKRIVMIGPPNQGSAMAQMLKKSYLFNKIAGVSGAELARTWDQLAPTLATPVVEFGIIAGGQASEKNLSNYVLQGPDDFTVSVEEAKLVGASDMMIRPLLHSTMMQKPVSLQATLSFFENGYFVSAQEKNPIVAGQQSGGAGSGNAGIADPFASRE